MTDEPTFLFGEAPEAPSAPVEAQTDRWLVVVDRGGEEELERVTGISLARADADDDAAAAQLEAEDGVLFPELGVAAVRATPEIVRRLGAAVSDEDSPIRTLERERVVWAIVDPALGSAGPAAPAPEEYVRGFLDGATNMARGLVSTPGEADSVLVPPVVSDESQATWGLQVTGVVQSSCSGRGVKLAVLDTGVDATHPDLVGRQIIGRSFVRGQAVQDGHGHGTHCIGTASGPLRPQILPRYGIAYNSTIHAGKVLSNGGSGSDVGILAGINWAVANGCRIVSMSLGAPTDVGARFSEVFEVAARRAMASGTLLIAAAGNNRPEPVNHPANCPSIMAVSAVDVRMQVAPFSARGVNPNGGQVDIAGPGVNVYSSWPMPTRYRRANGTSMATPHVAGIAALHAEANPDASASNLWNLLLQTARRLPLPSVDVGAGLAQAP